MSEEFRVDAHVKVLSDAVVERAKAAGLDALVYAPHFTRLPEIRRRADHFSDDELLVVPGREVFTGRWSKRKHVLALGLEGPVPDYITLEGAMAEFDRQDATVVVPHPDFLNVSFSSVDMERYADAIDAVEGYNAKLLAGQNRRAARLADRIDRPPVGVSYAHLTGTVGEVWTTLEADPETPAEVVAALADPTVERRIGHRDGLGHRLRRAAEWGHLGWENSWKKIDRILLSGTEPTHPTHIAYDGRFDDVAVY